MEFIAASMAILAAYLIFRQPRPALCGLGHAVEVTELGDWPLARGWRLIRRF